MTTLILQLAGGKYTYRTDDTGRAEALRYGEPWRDLTGDRFISALASRAAIADELLEALQGVTRTLEAFSYTNQFGHSQRDRLNKARATIAKARGLTS